MQLQKEKAQLSFEIMKKFAPYMDHSNELNEKVEPLLEQFEVLIESFRDLDEDKKTLFKTFMGLFSDFIDHTEKNQEELKEAYTFLSDKTLSLVDEYKAMQGL